MQGCRTAYIHFSSLRRLGAFLPHFEAKAKTAIREFPKKEEKC